MKHSLTPRRRALRLSLFPVLIFLIAAGLWLLQAPASTAQEAVTPPASTPDATTGLQIYAQRCANCHGPRGLGDGRMADQLPQPPTALGDPQNLRQAVPATLFEAITNGIVSGGMPPFGPASSNPLGTSDRWNLVAAIYSLGTPPEAVEEGAALYEANCVSCHGERGAAEEMTVDLSDPAFWLERSDQDVFTGFGQGRVAQHADLQLDEEEMLAVVRYARTLSYAYVDPAAAFAPIETAIVTGTVTNQTTESPLAAGTAAVLNGLTSELEPSLTMTTTLDEAGQYSFELERVPPNLVYVVTVAYEGISYGSDVGRLDRDNPTLRLPVPVYERTSDPSTVRVGQLHVILEISGGQVQVGELYQFSQEAPAVYVGEAGDVSQGTVRVSLPDGASSPGFQRSFGGVDSFVPAENVIQTEEGWADTVPLRPGQGTLSLLVQYSLPYQSGASISHPVHYPVDTVNLVMPEAGVELADAERWQVQEPRVISGTGVLLNYSRQNVAAGEDVTFTLQGQPLPATDASAAATVPTESTGLLVGGAVLLLALVAGAFVIRRWRGERAAPQPAEAAAKAIEGGESAARKQALLEEIAALDDAYEAGDLEEADYRARRAALKEELIAIWED